VIDKNCVLIGPAADAATDAAVAAAATASAFSAAAAGKFDRDDVGETFPIVSPRQPPPSGTRHLHRS